ncbi:MAG: lamin tail domain-containing protein, partial [Paludibacteraceae bacterium]
MKKALFLMFALIPFVSFSQGIQWSDDFSDGDFTQNPIWSGMPENFVVNAENQLQANASATSKSYLTTPSEAFDDATWEFWVRINYNPSSSNYSMVYIISDRADVSEDVYGYYVQIGTTADEISLYRQQGTTRTKIIDGTDKTVDTNPVMVRVKVTRSKDGTFALFRQRQSTVPEFNDTDYVQEGSATLDDKVKGSKYFGVLFSNTSSTGKLYFFDDIVVKGDKLVDVTPPIWTNLSIQDANQLVLSFSESVDISDASFSVDNGIGNPTSVDISDDGVKVTLTFSQSFEKGRIYKVDVLNLKDTSGNPLSNTRKEIGIIENIDVGDLIINEILFDAPTDGVEYFEVFNTSAKVLDLSKVYFGTRSTNGTFSPSYFFPSNTVILPGKYLALTPDATLTRSMFSAPDTANIVASARWSSLSNTGANFLLTNHDGDTIYDEV